MSVVAITGVSGYVGTNLANQYAVDDETDRIIGIDIEPFRNPPPKMTFVKRNVCESLEDIFVEYDVDTAVHLAYIIDPIHDTQAMEETNVDGARRFLEACGAANVETAGIASSALAYGAYGDNPAEHFEGHPLRGDKRFHMAKDKVEVERMAQQFVKDHPDVKLQVYRPAIVYGPNADNFFSRFLGGDSLTCLKGYNPLYQLVHEDDLTLILFRLLKRRKVGVYNIAADGVVPLKEIAHLMKKRLKPVSEGALRFRMRLGWTFRFSSLPPTMLDYLKYSCVVSNRKVKRELNYRFKYSSKGTLMDSLEN